MTDTNLDIYYEFLVKKNIIDMPSVLKDVLSLRPVKYHYNHNEEGAVKSIGFIAQEVQEVFPDLVYTEDGTQLALAPSDYGVLSIKAIQEQQKIIESQKAEIDALKAQMKQIQEILKNITNKN